MATTLQNAYDRIRLRLGVNANDPTLTDSQLTDFVNAGLRQADNMRNWWFNEAVRTFSTADGTATYAFDSTHKKTSALAIGDDILPFRTKLDMIKFSEGTGRPRFWSVEAGQIKLYPTPDAVYTVSEVFQTNTTALSSVSDEFDWPDDMVDLPILLAAQLAASKVRPEMIQLIAPEVQRVFQAIADDSQPTYSSTLPQRRGDWTV